MLAPDGTFHDRNPRTAIGVNRKGTTLFLMAVDGRLHNQAGVTLPMLGRLMKRAGAYNAVNYDGGGGTLLWALGQRDPEQPVRAVRAASAGRYRDLLRGTPGNERLSVSHLGLRL